MRGNNNLYVGASAGAYPWIQVDHHIPDFNISYRLSKHGSGDNISQVQYTLTNLEGGNQAVNVSAVSALANTFVTLSGDSAADSSAAVTSNNITRPCVALRVNVVSVSGSSNIVFQTLQAGN